MQAPTYAILLILIVGGVGVVTAGTVFAAHDSSIEHLGSILINNDVTHNTEQSILIMG